MVVRNTSRGVAADAAVDDDLYGEAADVEVVGDQRLEERLGPAGRVQHDGAGDLDLIKLLSPRPDGLTWVLSRIVLANGRVLS